MILGRTGVLLVFFVLSVGYASAQQRRAPGKAAGTGYGEFFRVEFQYRNWNAKHTTELEIGPDSTNISLGDDLNLPDERINAFMGTVRILRFLKARGSYLKRDYEGSATIRRDRTIGGVTFPALTDMDTALTIEYTTIGAEGDLYETREFIFSVVGDYTRFRADTAIRGSNGGSAALGRREVALLTLGLKVKLYLTPAAAVVLEASGMRKGGTGALTNLDATFFYNFNKSFAVSLGYENRYARIDRPGRREIFRLAGAYFGVAARF